MIHSQNSKYVNLLKPQSFATGATITATVSVVGYDHADVIVHLDSAAATSTDAGLTLTEGDAASFATHADLSITTVAPDTNGTQIYRWSLDLNKRKKNLKISYTPGFARLGSAHIVLSRPEAAPTTAAGRGLAGEKVT